MLMPGLAQLSLKSETARNLEMSKDHHLIIHQRGRRIKFQTIELYGLHSQFQEFMSSGFVSK